MKNALFKTLTALSLVITSNFVFAEKTFSYDFVEAGYTHSDVKTSTSNLNYNGYKVKGVKEVASNIHVLGEYMNIERSDNTGLSFKTLGLGLHQSLSVDTDLVVDVCRTKWTSITDASNNGNFNSGEIKLRHNFSDDLELSLNYEKHNTATGYDGFSVGAVKKINNNLSMVFDYASLNRSDSTVDWDMSTLSFRRYY